MTEHPMSQFEAYLDGLLSGEDLRAFEQLLRDDPRLQAALRMQRMVDDSLRRSMSCPKQGAMLARLNGMGAGADGSSAAEIAGRLQMPATPTAGTLRSPRARLSRRPFLRRLAIAAVFVGGLYGAWSSWKFFSSQQRRSPDMARVTIAQYYQFKVADGFRLYWVCENDEQFAQAVRLRLGQGLVLHPPPANIQVSGLDYSTALSLNSMALLTHVDKEPVIVLIDGLDSDHDQPMPPDSPLRLYKRTVGNLVLVEVSKLDQPRVLDLFYDPDAR